MEYKRLGNKIVVRLDPKDEILEQLKNVAIKENVKLASVSGIGAACEFVVGVYDLNEKKFLPKTFKGTYEIVSLVGNINTMNGEYYGHIHFAAGDESGVVVGGHLSKAIISATSEIFIDVVDGVVDREKDPVTGLNIFKF